MVDFRLRVSFGIKNEFQLVKFSGGAILIRSAKLQAKSTYSPRGTGTEFYRFDSNRQFETTLMQPSAEEHNGIIVAFRIKRVVNYFTGQLESLDH